MLLHQCHYVIDLSNKNSIITNVDDAENILASKYNYINDGSRPTEYAIQVEYSNHSKVL